VLRRFPTPEGPQLALLAGCALAGGLGLLPGAGGGADPVALLGWLALLAPAAGVLCGGSGAAFFPFALAVPACWLLLLVLGAARAVGTLPSPLWAACALTGLFGLGFALGARTRSPWPVAGLALVLGLVLSGASVGLGLLAGGSELAREHPAAAARLLDVSPLVLLFDCAGHDWTHAQPEVYAQGGVEWVQRRPWPGSVAGPTLLVLGCALAWLARRPGTTGVAP